MKVKSSRPITISLPFIYLKQKGLSSSQSNKIPYPNSFTELFSTATKIYKSSFIVKSLYFQNGEQLDSIDLLVPGCIVYVSSLDPFENVTFQQKAENKTPKIEKKAKIINTQSYEKIFGLKPDENVETVIREDSSATSSRPSSTLKFIPRSIPKASGIGRKKLLESLISPLESIEPEIIQEIEEENNSKLLLKKNSNSNSLKDINKEEQIELENDIKVKSILKKNKKQNIKKIIKTKKKNVEFVNNNNEEINEEIINNLDQNIEIINDIKENDNLEEFDINNSNNIDDISDIELDLNLHEEEINQSLQSEISINESINESITESVQDDFRNIEIKQTNPTNFDQILLQLFKSEEILNKISKIKDQLPKKYQEHIGYLRS